MYTCMGRWVLAGRSHTYTVRSPQPVLPTMPSPHSWTHYPRALIQFSLHIALKYFTTKLAAAFWAQNLPCEFNSLLVLSYHLISKSFYPQAVYSQSAFNMLLWTWTDLALDTDVLGVPTAPSVASITGRLHCGLNWKQCCHNMLTAACTEIN